MDKRKAVRAIFHRNFEKIVDAETITLSMNAQAKIQFVSVHFRKSVPAHWADFPVDEGNWFRLDTQKARIMEQELSEAIHTGNIKNICLSFDPWGEDFFLTVDLQDGWAALLYNVLDGYTAAPYNSGYANLDEKAPVQIGGQTPVPKMFALQDLNLVTKIILYILDQGRLYPGVKWIKSSNNSLPWR